MGLDFRGDGTPLEKGTGLPPLAASPNNSKFLIPTSDKCLNCLYSMGSLALQETTLKNVIRIGAVDRDRTDDLGINSPTLYRLSYDGLWIGET
jgi:hypothetical protein